MEFTDFIDIKAINYNKEINIKKQQRDITVLIKSLREILSSNYVDCLYDGEKTLITTEELPKNVNKSKENKKYIKTTKEVFSNILIHLYEKEIKYICANTRKKEKISAKTLNYKKLKWLFLTGFITVVLCLSKHTTTKFFLTIVILYHTICTLVKSVLLIYGALKYQKKQTTQTNEKQNIEKLLSQPEKLPKYTIIIPMFKENEKTIKQVINSITSFKYPTNKLDVLFALEEDDEQTKKVLQKINTPDYITKIWVPYFEPRTKPKACNVVSLFAKGEYIVIYDAEDIPEPEQLIKSVYQFQLEGNNKTTTTKKTSILQGCLSFYNNHENILTEFFNIEYLVHFKFLLYAYSLLGITIPLGGTSNHINTSSLVEANLWDSFNVTEDLELSTIVQGKSSIKYLDSDTKEWCVNNIKAWLKQRVRWMKGYILTYIVCIIKDFNQKRNKQAQKGNLSGSFKKKIKNIIFKHIVMGYTFFAFLLLPFTIYSFFVNNSVLIINYLLFITSIFYYSTIITSYVVICKKQMINIAPKTIIAFVCYPLYFILHCLATFIAIVDIAKRPFFWDKTEHNI